jgi:hypothetical protein
LGLRVRRWQPALAARGKREHRALVEAYLKRERFVADFVHLCAEQKWRALEAVSAAWSGPALPAASPVGRIVRARSPEWQERIRDAARRLPDDKSIVRVGWQTDPISGPVRYAAGRAGRTGLFMAAPATCAPAPGRPASLSTCACTSARIVSPTSGSEDGMAANTVILALINSPARLYSATQPGTV